MKTNIGLDIRMIAHTGIGTYLRGILGGWSESGWLRKSNLALFGNSGLPSRENEIRNFPFEAPIYSIQEQIEYPSRVGQCRLWHSPHYNIPIFKGKTKLVVTVHDLIHWVFRHQFFNPPQALYARFMFKRCVKEADHMIAVSEHTRKDLIQHFQAEPSRISVIYEAVSSPFHPRGDAKAEEKIRRKYHLPDQYFLYVGSLKPHKNVLWLIRLFRQLKKAGKIEADLVLVGKPDKKYSAEFKELAELRNEKGIVHLPDVDETELPALYRAALALLHPSLYEGFGLTLLEAMACETPVIANRTSSIPEVVGDAACLLDSNQSKDWQEAIQRFEKDSSLRAEYREKGKKRADSFDWKEAAKKTAEVYERVLSSK